MQPRTPITIITGSLGSGKTTLLRRILDAANRRLAVLMNEFGEIAIDGRVIQGKNVLMVELGGGCVCCSLTGEFEAAITEIIDRIAPELIVVESTGVAEADALVYEIEDSLPALRLDGVITIVDLYATIKFPQLGYTTRTQLQAADIIIINKIDLASADELKQVEELARKYNDRAIIFKTIKCDMDTNLLFGLEVERSFAPASHRHKEEFQSFTFTSDRLLSRERFEEFAASLPGSVYRAKGFARFEEGPYLFNYVAGRADFEPFQAAKTELVFIGRNLVEVKEDVINRLKHCER